MAATVYERDNCGAGPCLSTRYRPCTQAQKWTLGPCVQTVSNLLVLWQSTSLFSELSSCLKTEAVRTKWSNYVHSHILGTQCEHSIILCRYPGTRSSGSRAPSADSPLECLRRRLVLCSLCTYVWFSNVRLCSIGLKSVRFPIIRLCSIGKRLGWVWLYSITEPDRSQSNDWSSIGFDYQTCDWLRREI